MTRNQADCWALVADDLTGAADAAVGFAEQGWDAELILDTSHVLPGVHGQRVMAAVTGVRAADAQDAAAGTADAVKLLVAAGATRLFLKVDSVGRGSIGGQVSGAVSAWQESHPSARAIVCPAYPALGRSVSGGSINVEGGPDADRAAALDTVTPRATADLTEIVPGSVLSTIVDLPASGVAVVDAESDTDLDVLAALILDGSPDTIAVGSGGLAEAIARVNSTGARHPRAVRPRPSPARHVLVAVSSRHPVAIEQARVLTESAHSADLVEAPRTDGLTATAAAAQFARRVLTAFSAKPPDALVLVGGDGAASVLALLGAARIELESSILPGCPHGVIRGGLAGGVRLVTKSGGFGAPDALVRVVRALTTTPPLDHPTDASRLHKEAP